MIYYIIYEPQVNNLTLKFTHKRRRILTCSNRSSGFSFSWKRNCGIVTLLVMRSRNLRVSLNFFNSSLYACVQCPKKMIFHWKTWLGMTGVKWFNNYKSYLTINKNKNIGIYLNTKIYDHEGKQSSSDISICEDITTYMNPILKNINDLLCLKGVI